MYFLGRVVQSSHLDICKELWRPDILCADSGQCLGNVSLSSIEVNQPQLLKYSPRFWATVAPVGAEVVGIQVLPSALSITWIVLVLPCTFAEPMGLELRATSGDIYLHAQLFTGFMYIGAALCMWFLRAWKVGELENLVMSKEKREEEIRNDDAMPRENPVLLRHMSATTSVKDKAKGFISWQKV